MPRKQRKIRRENKGVCVYCGQREAETNDHIPPLNLFAKPRPNTLVTVPSCLPCNAGASSDDEYFRLMVAFRHDVTHPDATAALDSAIRSLSRRQAGGLRAAFLSGMEQAELQSESGLYLGRTGVYNVDAKRLGRVACRITVGLFYKMTGRPLPRAYRARAYLLRQIDPSSTEAIARLSDMVDKLRAAGSPSFIGRRVLSYRWLLAVDDPNASAWLLTFYDRVSWLTITMPRAPVASMRWRRHYWPVIRTSAATSSFACPANAAWSARLSMSRCGRLASLTSPTARAGPRCRGNRYIRGSITAQCVAA